MIDASNGDVHWCRGVPTGSQNLLGYTDAKPSPLATIPCRRLPGRRRRALGLGQLRVGDDAPLRVDELPRLVHPRRCTQTLVAGLVLDDGGHERVPALIVHKFRSFLDKGFA